jgi:hypothetical protein
MASDAKLQLCEGIQSPNVRVDVVCDYDGSGAATNKRVRFWDTDRTAGTPFVDAEYNPTTFTVDLTKGTAVTGNLGTAGTPWEVVNATQTRFNGVLNSWPGANAVGVLTNDGAGNLTWAAAASASPGGADTNVQYNNAGAFGGSADYTFDKTDLWTYGGVSNTANVKLGSGAAATVAAGQHLFDLGAPLGGGIATAQAAILRLQGTGAINTSGHDYFGWLSATSRLFLRLSGIHEWYFGGEINPTYQWQTGTAVWTDRFANNGEMFFGFSTGVVAAYNLIGNARRWEIDGNVGGAAATAANTFKIDGRNVFASFDEWEIRVSGTTGFMTLRSSGYINLYPVGISTGRSVDEGLRAFPENYMRLTTAGFFAFFDVGNEDWTGTRFWRPNSGTGTGYVYGAGINGSPLRVDTDLAAGSSFYVYGADLNHATGSGTVGFQEWRDNGTVVYRVMLSGDVYPRNVAYAWPGASAAGVLTNDGAGTLTWTAAVGGSGVAGQVSYWSAASTQAGDAGFTYDATNNKVLVTQTAASVLQGYQCVYSTVTSDWWNDATQANFGTNTAHAVSFRINGFLALQLTTGEDVFVTRGLNVGGSADPGNGDGIFTNGINVGFDATPGTDRAAVGDANHYLETAGGFASWAFDGVNNRHRWDRTFTVLEEVYGGTVTNSFTSTSAEFNAANAAYTFTIRGQNINDVFVADGASDSADLGGQTRLSGDDTPAALGATENNYNPTALSEHTILRLDANAGGSTITGIAGGVHGRVLIIINIDTTDTITLADENAGSTAANRFMLPGSANHVIAADYGSATLWYSNTDGRWLLIGSA